MKTEIIVLNICLLVATICALLALIIAAFNGQPHPTEAIILVVSAVYITLNLLALFI